MTNAPDPFDRFRKVYAALAALITSMTGAAATGHTVGWW